MLDKYQLVQKTKHFTSKTIVDTRHAAKEAKDTDSKQGQNNNIIILSQR